MVKLIASPSIIEAAGNKPKIIEEYAGRVNSTTDRLSIARMKSPEGWTEPGQTPEFDEWTLVLKGTLRVTTTKTMIDVGEGQAILAEKGEWLRYSTPFSGGAEYVSVCLPAFSPGLVHRDE